MNKLKQTTTLSQRKVLSQQTRQAIRLLQLNSYDLEKEVDSLILENPLLEELKISNSNSEKILSIFNELEFKRLKENYLKIFEKTANDEEDKQNLEFNFEQQHNNKTFSQLKKCGLSKQKVKGIKELSKKFLNKEFNPKLINKMDDEDAIVYLSSLRQIGRWSAEMILLFTFNRQNTY